MFGILLVLTCREYLESLARLRLGKRQDFLILLELVPAYRTCTVCSGALFTRVRYLSSPLSAVGPLAFAIRDTTPQGGTVFFQTRHDLFKLSPSDLINWYS